MEFPAQPHPHSVTIHMGVQMINRFSTLWIDRFGRLGKDMDYRIGIVFTTLLIDIWHTLVDIGYPLVYFCKTVSTLLVYFSNTFGRL